VGVWGVPPAAGGKRKLVFRGLPRACWEFSICRNPKINKKSPELTPILAKHECGGSVHCVEEPTAQKTGGSEAQVHKGAFLRVCWPSPYALFPDTALACAQRPTSAPDLVPDTLENKALYEVWSQLSSQHPRARARQRIFSVRFAHWALTGRPGAGVQE